MFSKKLFLSIFLSMTFSNYALAQNNRYIIKGLSNNKGESEIRNSGGEFKKQLKYHSALVASMGPQALNNLLKKFPGLSFELDHTVNLVDFTRTGKGKPGGTTPPAAQSIPWGITAVKGTLANAINKGDGTVVCVVDTGIDKDHSDLADNIVGGENFVSIKGKVDSSQWNDDNDHGTHVSGTIAAIDNNIGVVGVAPNASLFGVKVLDRRGSGFTSDVADGVRSCIANNAHIISMSLGSSQSSTLLHDAIIDATNAGIYVVAAAGNDGGPVGYPAAHAETIAVSATDSNNQLAYFSNKGPEINFAAPGVNILSTVKGGGYSSFNGTSMATPHVSGVLALMISSGMPSLKADDIGLSIDQQGSGLVNALRTVSEY